MGLPDVLPARHPDVDVAEFETVWVVFDSRVEQVHVLSGAGAMVFDACDGVTRSSVVVDEMVDGGFGSTDEARRVVDGVLQELACLGLLEGSEPTSTPPCLGCAGTVAPRRRRLVLGR